MVLKIPGYDISIFYYTGKRNEAPTDLFRCPVDSFAENDLALAAAMSLTDSLEFSAKNFKDPKP